MILLIALAVGFSSVILEGAETNVSERTDLRRPIWNIGNMVNAIYQIDDFLDDGANAIETDITFDNNGKAKRTYHGFPCDCNRKCHKKELINNFLKAVRKATTPGNSKYHRELVLLIFDMKTDTLNNSTVYEAGRDFAERLLKHYWKDGENGGRAYVVLSIPNVDHYEFIKGFAETLNRKGHSELMQKVGYDFSGNDDLNKIRDALHAAGVKNKEHIWQSDGSTNCIPRNLNRVRECVENRDSSKGYINKVYYWTVDEYLSIRDALDAGVDGIMTNDPIMVNLVLQPKLYSDRFRLATYTDNPFETFGR